MMKISLAEFIGGKEADDAYNKLCELTGLKWEAIGTCVPEYHDCGDGTGAYYCSYCGDFMYIYPEDYRYCYNCGAKIEH